MDYLALVKRAFSIVVKNKFLWIFGFFAGSIGGYSGYFMGRNTESNIDMEKVNLSYNWLQNFYTTYTMEILVGLLAILLIFILVFILSIISQASLIKAVAKINDGEKMDFRKSFNLGASRFWQVWGVMIVFSLILLAIIVIISLPIIVLGVAKDFVLLLLWVILALFLLIPASIIISVIMPYSQRFAVLEKCGVLEAIKKGYEFCKKHLLPVLMVYLIIIALGMIFSLLLTVFFLVSFAILGLIGMGFVLISEMAGIIYASLASAVIIFGIFVLTGGYAAFQSAIITLTYEQLKHKSN